MDVNKQTCLFVATISLHAKPQHNGNAWKLVSMYVQATFWVLHESSTNAQKWVLSAIMKPDDKIWISFSYQFLNSHLNRFGWLYMPWKWCQYNSETAAREHKTL